MLNGSFSDGDYKRYANWQSYLKSQGTSVPLKKHYLGFASLSTLVRLRPLLAELEPNHIGPMRMAISELNAKKTAKAGSKAKGGKRGLPRQVSVEKKHLPEDWKATIVRLYADCELSGDQWIDFDEDLAALPLSTVRDAEYILCLIAKSCLVRGKKITLQVKAVRYWISDALTRGCGARGLSCQIGKLRSFVIHHQGEKAKLARKLSRLRKHYNRLGAKEPKRKERLLLAQPNDIGNVWLRAEKLLKDAENAPQGQFKRYKAFLDAAALALSVVAPLRISDLHRLEIGTHLIRHPDGWEMDIVTQKTGSEYHRDLLWPEVTPFLDALIREDAPGGDFNAGYATRIGTQIFSRDNGKTGLSGDWISDVWFDHFGCGEHIVRTLWHDGVFDEESCKTYIALALCGQESERTAAEYTIRDKRKRNFRKCQQLRANYRKRIQIETMSS